MIKSILVGLLLLSAATALNTYSYNFPASATSTQVKPSYPLGLLQTGSILSVTLQLPVPNANTLSAFIVRVKDANNLNVIQALSFAGTTSTATWSVTAQASYTLEVTTATSGGTITPVLMYYLSATVGNMALLRITDVLRQNVVKYFYISPSDEGTLNLTIFPASGSSLILLTMVPGNQFLVATSSALTPVLISGGLNTYALTGLVKDLYYALVVSTGVVVSATVNFQSSLYQCPYNSAFSDYNSVFTGCSTNSQASNSGLPCTSYDFVNLRCLACISSYNLTDGVCLAPTACGDRQYFTFGSCYNVSVTCGNFDLFTGACTTCANTTLFVLVGSQCVPSNISFCPNGTHLFGSFCISDNCSAAATNGSCTACTTSAFSLVNGSCLSINCGVNAYYSVVLNNCTSIPVECTAVSALTQKCTACAATFFFFYNVCIQPSASANCTIWNFTTNICDLCATGFIWSISLCLKVATIPSSCPTGQTLVDNVCVTLPANCLALNSYYICTQCAPGFRISSGSCLPCTGGPNPNFPCVNCPLGQYVDISGNCRLVSPLCSSANQLTGLCDTCTSGKAPVTGICCTVTQSVVVGKCVDELVTPPGGGQLPTNPSTDFGGYYKYCKIFSPPIKACTECLRGRIFDFSDHCI